METYSENIAHEIYHRLRELEKDGMGIVEIEVDKGRIHYITNYLIYRFFFTFVIFKESYVISVTCYVDESEDDEKENFKPLEVDLKNINQVSEMAKLLCWINDRWKFGNFVIGKNDGGIYYRWGFACDNEELPQTAFAHCLIKPMELFVEHELSMRLIIQDNFTAEEAMD